MNRDRHIGARTHGEGWCLGQTQTGVSVFLVNGLGRPRLICLTRPLVGLQAWKAVLAVGRAEAHQPLGQEPEVRTGIHTQ
jgi:hypothetical protein